MITSGISQSNRIVKLNNVAKKQLQLLKNNSSVSRLEKTDEQSKSKETLYYTNKKSIQ